THRLLYLDSDPGSLGSLFSWNICFIGFWRIITHLKLPFNCMRGPSDGDPMDKRAHVFGGYLKNNSYPVIILLQSCDVEQKVNVQEYNRFILLHVQHLEVS
ncbi:hypothetical protein ACJX0J_011797, partial [Zea mays]